MEGPSSRVGVHRRPRGFQICSAVGGEGARDGIQNGFGEDDGQGTTATHSLSEANQSKSCSISGVIFPLLKMTGMLENE